MKKYIIFLFSIIILIGLINATNLNKQIIKNPSDKYGTIKIKDNNMNIADYTLNFNSDYCGTICQAEGKVILYKTGKLIDGIKFLKSKKETKINDYKIYYADKLKTYYIDVYGNSCKDGICNIIVKEIKEVLKPDYKLYNGEILDSGTYYFKIEGTKNKYDTIDWIINKNNQYLDEWAIWEYDFQDDFNFFNSTNWYNWSETVSYNTTAYTRIITDADNYMQLYAFNGLREDGFGHAGALMRTTLNYNDGKNRRIDFVMNYSMSSTFQHITAIDISNGTSLNGSFLGTEFHLANQDGLTLKSFTGSALKQSYYIILDGNISSLYYSNDTLINQINITNIGTNWYVQFRTGGTTTPAGGLITSYINLFSYNSIIEKTVVELQSPSNNSIFINNPMNFIAIYNTSTGYNLINTTLYVWNTTSLINTNYTEITGIQNI